MLRGDRSREINVGTVHFAYTVDLRFLQLVPSILFLSCHPTWHLPVVSPQAPSNL